MIADKSRRKYHGCFVETLPPPAVVTDALHKIKLIVPLQSDSFSFHVMDEMSACSGLVLIPAL